MCNVNSIVDLTLALSHSIALSVFLVRPLTYSLSLSHSLSLSFNFQTSSHSLACPLARARDAFISSLLAPNRICNRTHFHNGFVLSRINFPGQIFGSQHLNHLHFASSLSYTSPWLHFVFLVICFRLLFSHSSALNSRKFDVTTRSTEKSDRQMD